MNFKATPRNCVCEPQPSFCQIVRCCLKDILPLNPKAFKSWHMPQVKKWLTPHAIPYIIEEQGDCNVEVG